MNNGKSIYSHFNTRGRMIIDYNNIICYIIYISDDSDASEIIMEPTQ